MAISVIQRPSGHDSGGLTGNVSVAFGSNNTAGNTIIAIGYIDALSNSGFSTPTDTNGNTYAQIFDLNNGSGNLGIRAWIANNVVAGANTVTMNDANHIAALHLYEVSGLDTAHPFDKSASQYQASATSLDSTATATTAQANELLLGLFAATGNAAQTFSVGTNYSNIVNDGIAFLSTASEERIVSGTGTYNATATLPANSGNQLSVILTFDDGGAALTPNTSDSITGSESLAHYSDQVDVMENMRLTLVDNLNVADTATASENIGVSFGIDLNKSDTATATESLNPNLISNIRASDTATASESLTLAKENYLAVSDTSAITENTNSQLTVQINTSSSSTISELVSVGDLELISFSDNLTVAESVGILVNPLVQVATNTAATSSVTATLNGTPVQGHLMVALVYANKDQSVVSMSGWNLAVQSNFSTAISASLFYKSAGATESTSVTASATSATVMEIQVLEYAFSGATLDQFITSPDTGVNVTQRSSGVSGTTLAATEIVVAAVGFSTDQGDNLKWTNSFTGRAVTSHLAEAETTTSSTGAYSSMASWTTGAHAVGLLASFSNALSINASDSSTITESRKLLKEQNISLEDDSTVDDSSYFVRLDGVQASDNSAITENLNVALNLGINLADNLGTSELLAVQPDIVNIAESVSDNLTVSESLGYYSDQSEIMEFIQLQLITQVIISVFELPVITESLGYYSDQLDTMENVQIQVFTDTFENIGIGDTVDQSESSIARLDVLINISDGSTMSENAAVARNGTWEIAITDSRLLDESGGFILDENGNFITDENPLELATTTEAVQTQIITDRFINTSDNSSISEIKVVVLAGTDNITTFDALSISENVRLALTPLFINTSDTTTVSDNLLMVGPSNITLSESSTISEKITIKTKKLKAKIITIDFVLPTDINLSLSHNPPIIIDFAQPKALSMTLVIPPAISFTVLAQDEEQ